METAGLPSLFIQANSSLLASGDTLVVKCLVYNVSLLTLVNSYSINWFKDDVIITKSYNDVIDDERYSVQLEIASQGQNVGSKLQITGIRTEDEGSFICELTNNNDIKRRQSIFIQIDDMDDTTGINTAGDDGSDEAANSNITGQSLINYHNRTSTDEDQNGINITIVMEFKTDIRTTERSNTPLPETISTEHQVDIATQSGQDSIGVIMAICVPVLVIVLAVMIIIVKVRHRKMMRSLYHLGTNYARPQRTTSLEHVEMNRPLTSRGISGGNENIATSDNIYHPMKTKRKNYEEATNATFLDEYETKGIIGPVWPGDLQTRTGDIEEATGGNNEHDPVRSTYAEKEHTHMVEPEMIIRDTGISSVDNTSFSVESLETDNANAKNGKKRKNQYEMCNKNFWEEFQHKNPE